MGFGERSGKTSRTLNTDEEYERVSKLSTLKIKAIFCDAGDTLFEARERIGTTYARFAVSHGACPADFIDQAALLDQRFKAAFKVAPLMAFPGATEVERSDLEREWWRDRVTQVFEGIEVPQFEAFFEALYAFFGEAAAWKLFPETVDVLRDLKNSGIALSIISNFDSRLPGVCEGLGIADYFDRIIFSSAEVAAKPLGPIYLEALRRADCRGEQVLFVGDNPSTDVEGPEAVGIRGVLLDRRGRYQAQSEYQCIPTLSALSGLLASD